MRALVGLAAVGALTLTACNDDTSSDSAKNTPPPTAAPTTPAAAPTMPVSTPTSPAAAGSSSSTPAGASATAPAPATGGGKDATPGQTFKIGQPAQVQFTSGSTKGVIALSVSSIETGDPADLDALKLGDKVKGLVPYYVHYTITNTGTTDLAYTSVDHVKGLLPDGSEAQELMIIGGFAKCPSTSLPKGFTNGQTAQACAVALAPTATKVTGAEYWGSPYTLGKGAISWK
ncbi:hypothetical protein [Streptomyces sp. CB01881]|uniref:hypothetical protein n=1 Tax=Streptomyces sp. CB01881 TaxID=2078691 RepID=UPI000CDCA70B|nr:hypothetical protein [Streptomyces sp. CB01881]AUY50166.1 hypothetical protein C2142_15910 [Streptomyces sp. CB01881]TYC73558.1 hypothetical protein EH183_15890 [Streptomyces sp. CB01881]